MGPLGTCTHLGGFMLFGGMFGLGSVRHLLVAAGVAVVLAGLTYGLRRLRWRLVALVLSGLVAALLIVLWAYLEYGCVAAIQAPIRVMPDGSTRDNDGTVRALSLMVGALMPVAAAMLAALVVAWLAPAGPRGRRVG